MGGRVDGTGVCALVLSGLGSAFFRKFDSAVGRTSVLDLLPRPLRVGDGSTRYRVRAGDGLFGTVDREAIQPADAGREVDQNNRGGGADCGRRLLFVDLHFSHSTVG